MRTDAEAWLVRLTVRRPVDHINSKHRTTSTREIENWKTWNKWIAYRTEVNSRAETVREKRPDRDPVIRETIVWLEVVMFRVLVGSCCRSFFWKLVLTSLCWFFSLIVGSDQNISTAKPKKNYKDSEIELLSKDVVEEYVNNGDINEALKDFEDFNPINAEQYEDLVRSIVQYILEKSENTLTLVGKLFYCAIKEKKMQLQHFIGG